MHSHILGSGVFCVLPAACVMRGPGALQSHGQLPQDARWMAVQGSASVPVLLSAREGAEGLRAADAVTLQCLCVILAVVVHVSPSFGPSMSVDVECCTCGPV